MRPQQSKPVSLSSKKRRDRHAHNIAIKDLGRWKPQDDLSLVIAVQQTNDLEAVYRGVKFSTRFTLQEIEHRWYVLLFNPTIAKISVASMRQLHPDVIAQVHAKAPFSEEEERLLKKIPAQSQPKLEVFQSLLEKNIEIFLQYRTAKTLKCHWSLLKHYQLLDDQQQKSQAQTQKPQQAQQQSPQKQEQQAGEPSSSSSQAESSQSNTSQDAQQQQSSQPPQQTPPPQSSPQPSSQQSSVAQKIKDELMSFSDAEEMVERELEASLSNPSSLFRSDEAVNQELMLSNRKTIREIRQLENEIPRWQVLVDGITGVAPSDFDNETLAVLRGRLVRYLMRSREVTLGRCAKDCFVDVDLSLEGPSDKISRKQALIKLNSNGDFIIANVGKRPFHVDSKPVLGNIGCCKLFNNSVVEIAGLRFVFLVNHTLVAAVRAEFIADQHRVC